MAITVQEFRNVLTLNAGLAVLARLSKRAGYQAITGISEISSARTSIWNGLSGTESLVALTLTHKLTKTANSITPIESGEFPSLADVKTTDELLTLLPDTYNSSILGVSCPGYLGKVLDPYRYGVMAESTGRQALVFQFAI